MRGTVRTQVGNAPVAGATVQLAYMGPNSTPPVPYSALSTNTAADGTYSVAIPAGKYLIQFAPTRSSGLFLGSYGTQDPFAYSGTMVTVQGDVSNIDGSLAPGYLVSGTITDAATGQRTTCPVHSIQPGRGNVGPQSSLTWGFVDKTGNYTVWVPAGTYDIIVVVFEKCQTAKKSVVVNANVTGIDFALQPK